MATLTRRDSKNGKIGYIVQSRIKDKNTAKIYTRNSTWKATTSLTEKQAFKEATLYGLRQDEELSKEIENQLANLTDTKMTYSEFSKIWLDTLHTTRELNTYAKGEEAMKKTMPILGDYKLKDITPLIIQHCFNQLDKMRKTITTVTANSNLKKVMAEKDIGFRKLRYEKKLNSCSLAHAVTGKTVSLGFAKAIAKALKVDVKEIFDIKTKQEPYAFESLHRIKRAVRAMLSSAKKLGLVKNNYARAEHVDYGIRPQTEGKCLSQDEVILLNTAIEECENIKSSTSVMTILYTGMRKAEMCGLKWSCIDLDKREIKIETTITVVSGHGTIIKGTKTKKSNRKIIIPECLANQLAKYKSWQDNYKEQMGDAWTEEDWVFCQNNGMRINPSVVRNWFDNLLEMAGLQHYKVHELRHTYISCLLDAGVSPKQVADLVGHANPETTLKVYAHSSKEGAEKAASVMQALNEGKVLINNR